MAEVGVQFVKQGYADVLKQIARIKECEVQKMISSSCLQSKPEQKRIVAFLNP